MLVVIQNTVKHAQRIRKIHFPFENWGQGQAVGIGKIYILGKDGHPFEKKKIEIETWWKVNKVDYELPAPPSPGFPGSKLRGISRSTHTTLTQGVSLKFIKLSKNVTFIITLCQIEFYIRSFQMNFHTYDKVALYS